MSRDAYSLLRAWRACMTQPRPSDWELLVSRLLEDTDAALAGEGAEPCACASMEGTWAEEAAASRRLDEGVGEVLDRWPRLRYRGSKVWHTQRHTNRGKTFCGLAYDGSRVEVSEGGGHGGEACGRCRRAAHRGEVEYGRAEEIAFGGSFPEVSN